jgi:hypothetical protein
MPTSGDVVDLDLGMPEGRDAGFLHPAILVAAQRILDVSPSVVHVVPLTSTIRRFHSEIVIAADPRLGWRWPPPPSQHVRAVSPHRITNSRGNVGVAVLTQVREPIAVLLDLPD